MAQKKTVKSGRSTDSRASRGQIELFPTDGNTVRRAQAQPDEIWHSEEMRRRREAWEAEERAQRTARRIQRNRARAMRMNRIYVVFLSICVCAVFGICFTYIQMQSRSTQYKEEIAAIQAEVNDLKADNEEMLQIIETSVDLSEIMETATEELGMTYPSADQIITYDADTSDELTQYADVSSSAGSSILSGILGN